MLCPPTIRTHHFPDERIHDERAQFPVLPSKRTQTIGQRANPLPNRHRREHVFGQPNRRVAHAKHGQSAKQLDTLAKARPNLTHHPMQYRFLGSMPHVHAPERPFFFQRAAKIIFTAFA
jgi:hypothetical protein